MKASIGVVLLILFCAVPASAQDAAVNRPGPELSGGVVLGYYGGFGIHVNGMVSNLAQDFPMSIRFGLGYASVAPGEAAAARRIFINDATNGVPEKSGRLYDFRMDLMYPIKVLKLKRAFLFGGPRYGRFVGNFKYIGGNEDFDVKSNQWGFGAGIETFFAMSPVLDLVLTAGVDYYTDATLTGHDTSYNPDGDNANPRDDYTYDDADEAIDQPAFEPRIMMGFRYRF
ncbi:hypothetical protein GF377_03470 [candidate division GN15 bacterium]|nr:hypothetical protein [candidate division GN15 bacterium]